MLPEIQSFINSAYKDQAFFVPTEIFSEGFFLKVMFQFAIDHPDIDYEDKDVKGIMSISQGSGYFCEGLLYTHFRKHKDADLWESDTHADGVIGDFTIRDGTKARIILRPDAKQFFIIEAKMGSKLSSGITNASFYDQAARNVACITETLYDAELNPSELDSIGFYVIAPALKINEGIFENNLDKNSINEKILRRIAQYGPEHQDELMDWYSNWVTPTLEHIKIRQISWEEILGAIIEKYPDRTDLEEFYRLCLEHNGL